MQVVTALGAERFFDLDFDFEFAEGAGGVTFKDIDGLAAARAIEQTTKLSPEIKWPNDLLWQDRKLGGLLLEQAGD